MYTSSSGTVRQLVLGMAIAAVTAVHGYAYGGAVDVHGSILRSLCASIDLAVLDEVPIGTDAPAQQGIVRAGSHWITSKGNRVIFNTDRGYEQRSEPITLYKYDDAWTRQDSQVISYPGSSVIEHFGDIAYDGTHVWVPASDYYIFPSIFPPFFGTHYAEVVHVLKVDPDDLGVKGYWDVSNQIVDSTFGDFAGLEWREGVLYGIEYQDDTGVNARIFVFDVEPSGPQLREDSVYEISTQYANGLVIRGDHVLVSRGDIFEDVFIDRYSLTSLDPQSLNQPIETYRVPMGNWNLSHAEGLTFDGPRVWIAANDYAVEIESPLMSPANDMCADAFELSMGSTTVIFTDATPDGPPSCAPNVSADVWYTYTPSASGALTIDACGSMPFNTMIAIYTGCGCPASSADAIACVSGNCPDGAAELTATLEGGQCYLVRIGVVGDPNGEGTFNASFEPGVLNPCPWDTTGPGGVPDGMVGTDDFFALLQNWGPCPAEPAACPWDTTGDGNEPDGVVNTADFFALLQIWGSCE